MKNGLIICCVILMLMNIGATAHSQNRGNVSTIRIVYVDSLTSQTVQHVTTLLFDRNDSITPITYTYSNRLGEVLFNVEKNRSYRIVASFFGNVIYKEDFTLNDSLSQIERKVLMSQTKELEEVVVRAKPIRAEKGKMTLQVQAAGLGNALAAYTTYDVLSRTPRIQVVGSQVLIDGKPAEIHIDGVKRMNAHELLSLMSAEDIKKIEVQFGRDASISGEAAGGIVNISRKKQRGFTSSAKNVLSLTGKPLDSSPTTALMQDGNISLMYGTDKWQLYSRFSSQNGTFTGINHQSSYQILNSSEIINRFTEGKNSINNSCVGILGISATLGQHQLLAEVEGDVIFRDKKPQNNEFKQSNRTDKYIHYYTQSLQDKKSHLGSIILSHLWKSKGHQKKKSQTSMAYLFYGDKEITLIDTKFQNESQLRKEEGISKASNKLFFFKSEWDAEFDEGLALSAGVESNLALRTNNYEHRTGNTNDAKEYYRYQELLGAAFISLSKSWDKLFVSGGVRAEHTYLHSKDKNVSQGYTNWLPSLSVSYTTDDLNDLSFFYSRYLLRPSFDLLSNYKVKINDFLYFVGNPFLKTQQTDQFTLSYTTSNFSIATDYQLHQHVIEENFFTKDNTIYLTNENMDTRHEIRLVGGYNGNLFPFWHVSLNGGMQYMYIPNGYVQKSILQGYASVHNMFTISPSWQANININLATPWIMQTRWISGRLTSDIGVYYTTLNKQWNVGFKIENLIAKHSSSTRTMNSYTVNTGWSQAATRCLIFQLSYRFQTRKKINSPMRVTGTENRDRL